MIQGQEAFKQSTLPATIIEFFQTAAGAVNCKVVAAISGWSHRWDVLGKAPFPSELHSSPQDPAQRKTLRPTAFIIRLDEALEKLLAK